MLATQNTDVDRIGGKAMGLARLEAAGVRVPRWIVIGTDAFAAHVARAEAAGVAIAKLPLDPELAAAVAAAMPQGVPLAVRSSVVGEDSAGDSFAGLFDSFLFVEDVADAIVRCWASAYNPRALAYRRERGLEHEPAMGVIVQEAVAGEVSGVLFTANPVSGRRDEALISACWGLGEGVVSGRCDADELVLGHDGVERAATIAHKDVQVLPGGDAPVEARLRDVRCLSEQDAARLVEAGLRIGAAEDIEWTLVDGELVFLQARPITTLPPLGATRIVWDNSNIQESFNGVTTPLTFSIARRSYASIYTQTLQVLGVRGEVPGAHNLLGLVDGRVYYNIDNWYRVLLALPGFDRNKADMEHMMGLEDPVDFVQDVARSRREKLNVLPVLARLAWRFRRLERDVEAFMERFDERLRSFDRERLATASYGELIEAAARVQTEIVDRWIVPIVNDTYVMIAAGRLRRLVGEELTAGLLAGEEAVASAEPTRRLIAIAKNGRNDEQLDRFVDEFGDRCMGEMKLETISLRQDRTFLYRVLDNLADVPDLSVGDEHLARAAAARLRPWQRRRLRKRLDAVHRGVAARERMRLARTRFVGLFRDIYCAAGERLYEAGRLDAPRDVFYLTADELTAFHDGTAVTADLAALARLRKAEYAGYEGAEPPHHFASVGSPYHGERVAPQRTHGDELCGLGCSPGIVEAELHVVMAPDDDLAVNGKILTTRRTDPGWAPLFPSAAGLLIERGSTLSHSAVLAREFGIPCVVGVPNLLERVRHGERVRLDGTAGTVERLP